MIIQIIARIFESEFRPALPYLGFNKWAFDHRGFDHRGFNHWGFNHWGFENWGFKPDSRRVTLY